MSADGLSSDWYRFIVSGLFVVFTVMAMILGSHKAEFAHNAEIDACQDLCLPYLAQQIKGECHCANDYGWERAPNTGNSQGKALE